jgi:hypothetical protein
VLAILDSTKLLHLGSTVQDDRLLAEGRRRFLLTMNCLRSNVERDPSIALSGLMIVSLGVSLCEVSVFHGRYHPCRFVTEGMGWPRRVRQD